MEIRFRCRFGFPRHVLVPPRVAFWALRRADASVGGLMETKTHQLRSGRVCLWDRSCDTNRDFRVDFSGDCCCRFRRFFVEEPGQRSVPSSRNAAYSLRLTRALPGCQVAVSTIADILCGEAQGPATMVLEIPLSSANATLVSRRGTPSEIPAACHGSC